MTTPAAILKTSRGPDAAIFDDLASGTSFGRCFPVALGDETDVVSFALNSDGVTAFNHARGGFFSIGGSVAGEEGDTHNNVNFSVNPDVPGTQQLVVTCLLPTSAAECKNKGWRGYRDTFKNQGQCVAFVQRGPKP